MTLEELKQALEDRRRGIVAPRQDRLRESARMPFPGDALAEGCRLWYSILDRPQAGDVAILRTHSGFTAVGVYHPVVDQSAAPERKHGRRMGRSSDIKPDAAFVAEIELRPLNDLRRRECFARSDVMSILPVVDVDIVPQTQPISETGHELSRPRSSRMRRKA